jgi:hypothetical protein
MFRTDQAETQAFSSAAATAEPPAPTLTDTPAAPLGELKARISSVYCCTRDALEATEHALALAETIRHTSCAAHLRPKLRAALSILQDASDAQRSFLQALGASVRPS